MKKLYDWNSSKKRMISITMQIMPKRESILVFSTIVFIVLFWSPLSALLRSMDNERYSHILIIPFITGYLIYLKRTKIFAFREYSVLGGSILIAGGIITYLTGIALASHLDKNDFLSLLMVSSIILFLGSFILFYGPKAFREVQFPLVFLFFMVPIPTIVIDKIILFLQTGSAEVSYFFLNVLGVPVYRQGFVFHLPTITIEVSKECSGIRSSVALVIVTVVAAHLFLRDSWRRVVLLLCVIPMVIIKNGIRITVLSVLAAYVDTKFITNSALHRNGGILFFMVGVILLGSLLWLLGKYEKRPKMA